MLQTLENMYLNLLRVAVIAIAGILLVTSIIYGVRLIPLFKPGVDATVNPVVQPQDVIQELLLPGGVPGADVPSEPAASVLDPNAIYYDRSVKAMIDFLEVEPVRQYEVMGKMRDYIKSLSESTKDPELSRSFSMGLAKNLEYVLAHERIKKMKDEQGAPKVLEVVLKQYITQFNSSLEKEKARVSEEKVKAEEERAEASKSAYFAAASLASFMMIVFLSVFIKIERNLRPNTGSVQS